MFHKLEIYGATYCPYSQKAKMIGKNIKPYFNNVFIYMPDNVDELINSKKNIEPKTRTIPVVFVKLTENSRLQKIGGCSELINFCKNNGIDY